MWHVDFRHALVPASLNIGRVLALLDVHCRLMFILPIRILLLHLKQRLEVPLLVQSLPHLHVQVQLGVQILAVLCLAAVVLGRPFLTGDLVELHLVCSSWTQFLVLWLPCACSFTAGA